MYHRGLASFLFFLFPTLGEFRAQTLDQGRELYRSCKLNKYEKHSKQQRTDNVHNPVFEGWKKDSILVINRSNESIALDPAM
jgi:hypothetical protein